MREHALHLTPCRTWWLVVCRSKGRTPWYLLTAEPITTDENAWRVVFAYMRRWQIELAWRFDKSERSTSWPEAAQK